MYKFNFILKPPQSHTAAYHILCASLFYQYLYFISICNLCIRMCVCSHAHASVSMLICVCCDLSCGNSCSGVELITGWVFWGELPAVSPLPHPLSLSAVLQGSLQMTECFCPALWNPCHIPFRRTAQQQRSLHVVEQIGKRHRQNFGGKRPQFVPSGSCCRLSKESYFCFELPDLVCLCMVVRGRFMPPFPCAEKEKDTICFHTRPLWLWFCPCYFWKDFNAGLCWDWVYIIVLPRSVAQWGG